MADAPYVACGFDPGNAAHVDGLCALFEAAHSPCYCRYWHFEGDKDAWLARCAFDAEQNRRELRNAAHEGSVEAAGVVAIEAAKGRVIGWMKVAPAASVPKMFEQRYYRGLSVFGGDRTGVFVIGCALVAPEHRHEGVAHALVKAACALAQTRGARTLEALPRVVDTRVADEELWMGPLRAFEQAGFVPTSDAVPYPVLRRDLGCA